MKLQAPATITEYDVKSMTDEQLLDANEAIIAEITNRINSRYGKPTKQQTATAEMLRGEILHRIQLCVCRERCGI